MKKETEMEDNRFLLRQISVFLVNKPGALSEVTNLLSKSTINLRAFTLTETRDFGTIRIIVDDVDKAETVLEESNVQFNLIEVLAVEIDDQPGGMNSVVTILSDHRINIEYAYTTLIRGRQNAIAILRTDDMLKAVKVLKTRKLHLFTEQEIAGL